ncbi:MAG: riboflavin synthase, partial [candidate division Zixibacteria bacterium]|nr:riboflavin synthase [candidate division Zixibacteria bacterium]
MFTGLVQEKAKVLSIRKNNGESAISITLALCGAALGESIAINGCCLTVSEADDSEATFYVSPETISRTTLCFLAEGNSVNIEKSLALGDQMGGHFVSGHIDDIGTLLEISKDEDSLRLAIGYS